MLMQLLPWKFSYALLFVVFWGCCLYRRCCQGSYYSCSFLGCCLLGCCLSCVCFLRCNCWGLHLFWRCFFFPCVIAPLCCLCLLNFHHLFQQMPLLPLISTLLRNLVLIVSPLQSFLVSGITCRSYMN